MKLIVMIPKEGTSFWTRPIIFVAENWHQPTAHQYFEGVTEKGTSTTASVDDHDVYVWDAQTIFDAIAKGLWYSSQLLRF